MRMLFATTVRIGHTRAYQAKVYRFTLSDECVVKYFINGKLYEPATAFETDLEEACSTAIALVWH